MQSGVTVRADAGWFLINASPDVGRQLKFLQAETVEETRFSPIQGIFLTNADLDHVMGLFSLREGGPIVVLAPNGVIQSLEEGLHMRKILSAYCGMAWNPIPLEWSAINGAGFEVCAVPLKGAEAPRYHPHAAGCHAVGYLFRESVGGKIAGVFPDVALIDAALEDALRGCELLLFDGTFFDENELVDFGAMSRTAREMGHVPISGPTGSLKRLARLSIPTCAYLHINNTNPILRPDSPEHQDVEKAGLVVARDGMRFVL